MCEVRREIKHNLKFDIHILLPFIPQKFHCNAHVMCMDIWHVEDTKTFQQHLWRQAIQRTNNEVQQVVGIKMLILCLLSCSLPAPYGLRQKVQQLVTIEVMTVTFNIGMDTITRQLKVKQSHYRPRHAPRVSGGWDSQISRQLAHEGGKVVSPTHRPPLPPGNIPGTHFW
jgi:hypothetical protein